MSGRRPDRSHGPPGVYCRGTPTFAGTTIFVTCAVTGITRPDDLMPFTATALPACVTAPPAKFSMPPSAC